jgi:hypothetical protein
VQGCKRILIVDETRHSGGVAEALMAHFHEAAPDAAGPDTAEDSFIATGPAYAATMPSAAAYRGAAKGMTSHENRRRDLPRSRAPIPRPSLASWPGISRPGLLARFDANARRLGQET